MNNDLDHIHDNDMRLGTVWVDKSLKPLIPAAIFAASKMVLQGVIEFMPDEEFGTRFFVAAEIIAETLQAAKVDREVLDNALLGRDL